MKFWLTLFEDPYEGFSIFTLPIVKSKIKEWMHSEKEGMEPKEAHLLKVGHAIGGPYWMKPRSGGAVTPSNNMGCNNKVTYPNLDPDEGL